MSYAASCSLPLRAARRWMFCLIRCSVLAAMTLTPMHLLGHSLEAKLVGHLLEEHVRQSVLPKDASIDGIIVLGGSPTRIKAALELAEQFPKAALVLSGPGENEVAIAQEHERVGTLIIDRRARNTYENALYSKDLVAPHLGQCWAVVTSAMHMPRTRGAFQAVGFPVLPWPVDDTPRSPNSLSAPVWHEVLGLISYWALGQTRNLYPKGPKLACAEVRSEYARRLGSNW
jgi:uncharacterized SAM-binding protein YcdF (DUF218 family)